MTETSGYQATWGSAFTLARSMYLAFKYGKIAAWVYWTVTSTDDYALFETIDPTVKAHVHKNYARYIRPGAVQVKSTCDDGQVLVLAFSHKQNNCVTIVLINQASASRTVNISGAGLPGMFDVFRSSASENCAHKGTTSPGSVSLPSNSVTTLVAGTYMDNAVAVAPRAAVSLPSVARGRSLGDRIFTLGGRRLLNGSSMSRSTRSVVPGVYVVCPPSRATVGVRAHIAVR
jgi:hypothetical protein